jgi:hypothetical protein
MSAFAFMWHLLVANRKYGTIPVEKQQVEFTILKTRFQPFRTRASLKGGSATIVRNRGASAKLCGKVSNQLERTHSTPLENGSRASR